MFSRLKDDYPSWVVLIGSIILILDVTFYNKGLIFSLFFSGLMIYIGRKRASKKKGKFLFWGGIILACSSIFKLVTFRFLLVAILIHFVIQFGQSKKNPKKIDPIIQEPNHEKTNEAIIRTKPLFENILFGKQKTPEHSFEWNDINIQAGIGDTVIDFSYTVLPKGETVVFIRNFIGNIRVLVPYEIELSIHHSVIAGSTTIFGIQDSRMVNQVLHVQTPGYEHAVQKIKIFTSLAVGSLEVSRI